MRFGDLEGANTALQVLGQRISEMRSANTVEGFEAAWVAALDEFYRFYEKCKAACRRDNRQHFVNRMFKERKSDPLLSYLHQARNSDTHTIGKSGGWDQGSMLIGIPGPGMSENYRVSITTDHRGIPTATITSKDGLPVDSYITPASMYLINVTNQGVTFDVPTEHLGQKLKSNAPIDVAVAAQKHLRRTLDELAGLHP